jgi:hypothetical protein
LGFVSNDARFSDAVAQQLIPADRSEQVSHRELAAP